MKNYRTILAGTLLVVAVAFFSMHLQLLHPIKKAAPEKDTAPSFYMNFDKQKHKLKVASYCFISCYDNGSLRKIASQQIPLQMAAGETVTLTTNYKPVPTEALLEIINDSKYGIIEKTGKEYRMPAEAGIYYLIYSMWWEKRKNHAIFVVAIEIKEPTSH